MIKFAAFIVGYIALCSGLASAEHWWCKGCGLAYPASQKVCLNKDCPLYRKAR